MKKPKITASPGPGFWGAPLPPRLPGERLAWGHILLIDPRMRLAVGCDCADFRYRRSPKKESCKHIRRSRRISLALRRFHRKKEK